jgi:hypothetical protein
VYIRFSCEQDGGSDVAVVLYVTQKHRKTS